jgi:hypothetical protein
MNVWDKYGEQAGLYDSEETDIITITWSKSNNVKIVLTD